MHGELLFGFWHLLDQKFLKIICVSIIEMPFRIVKYDLLLKNRNSQEVGKTLLNAAL